jgi:Tol biopolymer transport system component
MPLVPGTRFDTYEVVDALGSGGMGEVYRARDTRLNRYVAVKVLLSSAVNDAATLARFEREAETLAALNHPGIAQIYGTAETDAGLALLIELVEGPTLADIVKAGPLPVAQVIDIAGQLTIALSYAHHAGVIHRDLKPANIKLRPDGVTKILDFGLAKKIVGTHPSATTVQVPPTFNGIAGTPGYMAPELLRGGNADARSDVFALGVVLFELLSGRNPFQRPSVFETAQAILDPGDPPWPPRLAAECPGWLCEIVAKAMAKDNTARYWTVDEMRHDVTTASSPASLSSITRPSFSAGGPAGRHFRAWVAAAIAVAAIVAAAVTWRYVSDTPLTQASKELVDTQVTFVGNVRSIALSPDGRTAAYAAGADGRVMVMDVTGGQALEVWRGTLVVDIQWMRDGSSMAISGLQDDSLGVWIVPRLGGRARRLPVRGAYLAFSPDGQSIATAMRNSQGFRISPLSTGETRTIKMDGFQWLLGIDWGPTSDRLVVLTQAEDGSRTISTIGHDGSNQRRLYTAKNLASVRWSPLESAIYAIRPRNELADIIRIDDVDSPPEPTTLLRGLPWDGSDPYRETSSLSTNGRQLLVIRSHTFSNLWRLSSDGSPPVQITRGTSRHGRPRVSPDGRWIATALGSTLRSAIVKLTIDGGDPIPLTSPESSASSPVWSPDGSQIAYVSIRADKPSVWVVAADGSTASEVANSTVEPEGSALEWLQDGRLLWMSPGGTNFAIRDLGRGTEDSLFPRVPDAPNGWIMDLRASPAGDLFAFWWNTPTDSIADGLAVTEWPSRRTRTLDNGDYYPAGWSRDGRFLFAYEFLGRSIMRVTIPGGEKKNVGQFPTGAIDGCDITPDRSVICTVRETQSDAWMVENLDRPVTVSH